MASTMPVLTEVIQIMFEWFLWELLDIIVEMWPLLVIITLAAVVLKIQWDQELRS
jgi:hypothetical protein